VHFDYSSTSDERPTGPSHHYRGVHQKIVIADSVGAYVGSGEIRENSFLTNGDAGYLTVNEGEVAFWKEFVEVFWEAATPVDADVTAEVS